MPVVVVVGAQYGSEAKGKVAAFLSPSASASVRTGGANSGHTVVENGRRLVLRHLPCAVVTPGVRLALGAGSILDLGVLTDEIRNLGMTPERLIVDPQAVVVSDADKLREKELVTRIGSTGKGVGAAIAAKVMREPGLILARDVPFLVPYLGDVAELLHGMLALGQTVLLEGTQGTGLSLHHGHYPYVTGRETTAASLCGEAGVGPTAVDRVVLVVRTYPIRVAGNSGPLESELSWDEVTKRSGYDQPVREFTTVTGNLRRVGEFDMNAIVRAVHLNGATEIAVTFADYLDSGIRGATKKDHLTGPVTEFVSELEAFTKVRVSMISTGPETSSMIQL